MRKTITEQSTVIMKYAGDDNENDNTIGLDTYGYPEIYNINNGNVEITLGWFMPHDPANEAAWYLTTNIGIPNYEKYHKQYLKRQKTIEKMLNQETAKFKLKPQVVELLRTEYFERHIKKAKLPKIRNEIVIKDLGSNFDFNFHTKLKEYGFWTEAPAYDRQHGAKPHWTYTDHHIDTRDKVSYYLKNLPYRTKRNIDLYLSIHSKIYRRINCWRRDREMRELFDPNSNRNRKLRKQAEKKHK